ncbi:DNA repair protein RadA [Peptoniphilus equinus]|uniref:DNA repair protein RadA n=1 Tax=Peptoniphilus equinus TaxID=3016343 RepID=A0ABY7QT13_9FIRM|nr:DNA repair protein RadA [Peptoniphilus equinus]WBW49471.1 DNA repair protein RadA [Peptoniphilus equinus]
MKKKTLYKCSACGYESGGYFGKCPNCDTWNAMEEVDAVSVQAVGKKRVGREATLLNKVAIRSDERIQTGMEEFDRVMGGGIVRDSVSIITAKPGAGKSTLLLQVAGRLAESGLKVLYASGEESASQIRNRAERILTNLSDIYILSTILMDDVLLETARLDADLVIVDSIQTFSLGDITSRPGSPTQVMECAHRLVELAKGSRPRMVFMVGQMTKDDELAGVRALEHLVDTVVILETDKGEQLRSLRASKNRYGSTGEMGFFLMDEKGLASLDNPSAYFMTQRLQGEELPGSALTVIKEGTRPIILEIEALASSSFLPYPSRISESMRRENLNTLISIMEQRAKLNLSDKNVVTKTTGGMKLTEPSANLAVIMSIFSSLKDVAIDTQTVFIADVGLTGELKTVPSLTVRLREAKRMGFKRAFIAPSDVRVDGLDICQKKTLQDVIDVFDKSRL